MVITRITIYQKRKLELDIETLRKEMIQIGMIEGLASKRTIKISKNLDRSIAKYQSLRKLKLQFYSETGSHLL
ncbi:aspartyl-phosphate phosphatase Spo0E family protein [Bacillus sp. BRMEA1]|uniref:aspartyl-phosphate phosphatase Spo0E family protein n=1 Tax=Neobacillus endophyticus TaxID=2738405 RepID=UPI0015640E8A|nr:aspartyl-phosphate phosphatase Spo0E family protein [Neobacillus endophyticus]NRD77730.1 aspartyl-phosphate phosphatase Spo0E family protein [Neobacillus endophyticus]